MKTNIKEKKRKKKNVIFGFGNYFENVTGEEQQRIAKLTLFTSLLISIRIHAFM